MAEQWAKFVDWVSTPLGIWTVVAVGIVVLVMIAMIVVSKVVQSHDRKRARERAAQDAASAEAAATAEATQEAEEPNAPAQTAQEPTQTEESTVDQTNETPQEAEQTDAVAPGDFVEEADGGSPAYLFDFSQQETPAAEESEETFEFSRADGKPAPARKRPFALRIACAPEKTKYMFGEIYNKFASYGIHGRIGGNRVNFKSKGTLYGRMTFGGTSVRLHLPLAVADYDPAVYKQEDLSGRRGFDEVPFTMRLRTKKSLTAALSLIDEMMEKAGVATKAKFATIDAIADYPDTYTHFEREGYGWLSASSVTRADVEQWSESFSNRILQTVKSEETPERLLRATVSIADIAKAFPAGAHVDVAALREKGLVFSNCNYVTVTASDALDKALSVTANEFEPHAVMMLCITGGEAIRVVLPEPAE